MHTNQAQQQAKFKLSLQQFQNQNNIKKNGALDGYFHDFRLYKLICRRGGSQAVTNRKQWAQIANELQVEQISKMKSYYLKYLHAYQRKYYFGKEQEQQLPNMFGGCLPRKMLKTQGNNSNINPNSQISNALNNKDKQKDQKQQQSQVQQQQQLQKNNDDLTYQQQLGKHFEQQQKNKRQFFLKKKKLIHSKAETKKIILGLQSYMDKTQTIYSLNILLMYSFNIQDPFLFEHNQKIYNALASYTQKLYPPQNEQDLQHLRTVTLIIRNLSVFPKNLKFILGTKLFRLLVKIFNTGLDPQQCSKNICDIMNGLVKVGWNCNQIIKQLDQAILQDKIQDVQGLIQMLRALVDQKQQSLIDSVTNNLKIFIRVLLSTDVSIDIKQQVLQIFAFVTDISADSKLVFIKNDSLLGILIGILQHMRNHEKLTQFSVLTLNNISTVTGAAGYLKNFETQLMMIGFTDDSLAGILANILADVVHT